MEIYGTLFYCRVLTSCLAFFLGKFDLLMLCGDVESNPGPRPNSSQNFSICHWILMAWWIFDFRFFWIFESIIYSNMLKYFLGNYLIFTKESGFRPVDSWVTQFLSIAHVFTSFDNGVEVKGVILDISKAVDKVNYM